MKKTLGEFLGCPQGNKDQWPKEQRTYYLDDVLENDPTKFCPRCDSRTVRSQHTHNLDGIDYECYTCKLRYELHYSTKDEEMVH